MGDVKMGTIVIFSRDENTLSDIKNRLVKMGFLPEWIPVEDWPHRLDTILHANGVILDEVDGDFARRKEVDELEQYLLENKKMPPHMILVPAENRRLDNFARSDPKTKVHHEPDKFMDEELYSLVHSRSGWHLPV